MTNYLSELSHKLFCKTLISNSISGIELAVLIKKYNVPTTTITAIIYTEIVDIIVEARNFSFIRMNSLTVKDVDNLIKYFEKIKEKLQEQAKE